MDKVNKFLAAAWGMIVSLLGVLAVPILLMVSCNIIDYLTGLMAAPKRGVSVDSKKGLNGIVKKISMWLLVIVGAIIDKLLEYTSEIININLPFTFLVASVVTVWLICNELLSILENIRDIGVPLPNFLQKIARYVKEQTEEMTDGLVPDTDDNETDKIEENSKL